MNLDRRRRRCSAVLLLALASCVPAHAKDVTDHVEAALVAENLALTRGDVDNWVALRLLPDRGWHTYWRNPGDSGLATRLQWSLPPGVTAGDIQWPYPHPESLGELTNYGYAEETLHLVAVRVPRDWPAGKPVELKAEAKWLVCSDICIPGNIHLALTLPVADAPKADPAWHDAFARTRAALPQPRDWPAHFAVAGPDVTIELAAPELAGADRVEMFPLANDLVTHAAPQRIAHDAPDRLRLSQHLSSYFVQAPATVDAVWVLHGRDGTRAYQVSAQPGAVTPVPDARKAAPEVRPATAPAAPAAPGLVLVLLFAMLGGVCLNLMPCVFPVLSLKALAVMQARDEHYAHLRHALIYTAGVVLSCVGIAALLMSLRAAGQAIGWGFQLQSPVFIGLLAYLLFALGLSLSGAVEFGTRLMGLGSSLTQGRGAASTFFTGVLAVVVASPCTAPFMGTAVGYAMTQPALVGLLVFAFLGLGLALPFLLLGIFPRLAALLPRPGAWMQTFRQAMAFPLYLTVAWLLWVLARQTDANGAAVAMIGLVLIAFALWLWPRTGAIATLLRLSALVGAVVLLLSGELTPRPPGTPAANGAWEPWSAARVAELRAQHRTVLVDFTADWCLTCKVNERTTLASDRVRIALRDQRVALLLGDWTRADPDITRVLESFGRNGVPLYLVYVGGGEPKVLPQLLTPDIVIEALAGKD